MIVGGFKIASRIGWRVEYDTCWLQTRFRRLYVNTTFDDLQAKHKSILQVSNELHDKCKDERFYLFSERIILRRGSSHYKMCNINMFEENSLKYMMN